MGRITVITTLGLSINLKIQGDKMNSLEGESLNLKSEIDCLWKIKLALIEKIDKKN